MSAALYIGRVGALAVALGIGVAIAGVPGLAWAGPEPGSDPADSPGTSQGPSTDLGDSSNDTGDTADKDLEGGGDSGDPGNPGDADDPDGSAGGMKVDSSGGALSSTHGKAGAKSNNKDRVADPPKRRSLITPKNLSGPAAAPKIAAQSVDQPVRKAQVRLAPSGVAPSKAPAAPQLKQSSTPVVDVTPPTRKPMISSPITATMSAAPKPSATTGVSRLLSLVTLSAPTAGDTKPVSTDSPLFAAFFAAGRQVSQKDSVEDESTARTVDSTQTSLMMAAVTSSPPTAGTLNQTTGAVTGSLNGWTIMSQPTSGTVTANGDTYTYTPTVVARLRAATTTLPDYDSFAVTISGQPASTVTVPILPAVLSNQSSIPVAGQPALNNPTGLAVNGTYAYVANQGTNTVSVINTATGTVVKTITVGSQPSAVAINPTAKRAYVANRASSTISVIDTSTNAVVGSAIRVGTSPQDVAVNTTGTPIVVVANNGSSNVTVIEPANNNKATTISLGFGNSAPTAVALSDDGTRAYVTHRTLSGGGAVSVINTSTKKVISTIAVGSSPQDVAVAGTKVYVANSGSSSVSVINTATNNSVTTVNVGSSPSSLAVSQDGSMVVVARNNDNIAIIDTKTDAVLGAQLLLDTTTPDGGHVVAFGSDGRILVTDAADRTVRVVGLARGNTAPITIANPTVDNQDTVSGVVTGALNIKDPDQDPLKYTVSGVPTATGSVTVDSTGTYTFTPSQAARDQAAQPGGANTITFAVRASDPSQAYKDITVTVPVLPTQSTPPGGPGVSATTTQIPLGAWPDFLATKGSRLYVLNAGESTVSVVDTNTNTVIQTSEPLPAGGAMTLSPDGRQLYVAEYMGNHVYVLDAATLQQSGPPINVVTTYGGTLAMSSDGSRLYVGSTDQPVYYDEYGYPVYGDSSAYVSVVDTASRTVVAQIPVGTSVGNVELSPDGKLLYANAPDRVYVIDTAAKKQVASFTVGGQPADVTFSADSKRAYITNLSSGELYVIDTATSTVVAKPIIDTTEYRYFPEWDYEHEAGFPTDLEMSEDGSRVYIARGDDIVVVDTATNSVIGTIRVATDIPNEGAQSLTIAEDGTIFVTLEDTVVAVDVAPSPAQSNLALAKGSGASLMMMAAVANSAPTASPSMGTPDQTTGQITGNVNATDVDGNPMTYTVPTSGAGAPTRGTVSVNQTTGAFTYKPTAAARTAAGISAGADFDTFTVTVSDGQGGVTPVSVQVAVLPGVFENSNTPGSTQANPSGVAIVGNRAYVANQGTNTVSVLDAATGAAVGSPIVVGSAPTGVAASPDGSKVYVTNRTSGSVSVIRTSDNKVVNTITVGTQPESVTFSTDGTRAYVTNYGSKSVSVIDTTLATPKVITTISNVGTNPRGIAYVQTANGPRVYVANSGAGTVSVINASTNKLIDTKPSTALTVDPISVGSAPQQIAVSPDGTRVYVTNQSSNSVSVINTATNALDGAAIAVGSKPAGIALSADGSTLYVANGDDSVFVVDTKTRSVFGVMTLDNAPENNLHAVTVRGDGSLLVTDLADRAVRIVNYKRGNTAPVATGSPTVGTPSLGNGAVIGNVNITDWDGDPLTYTTVTAPTKGSVSFNPASGTYTYTPTQAARDAAVQTPGLTDTFSVRATDPYSAFVSTASITVPILSSATNHAPTAPGYQYFDPTDSVTGEVRGRIIASDPDGNPLSYQVISGPWSASSFTFNSATGEFSYIPSQEKREYVTQWPGYDDYDYFQVVVSDGTASVSTSVNVLVSPIQMAPTAYYPPEVGSADPTTGRVSGSMNVYDPNGDTVAYAISSGPSRGTATVNAASGIYTYTPSSSERSVGGLDSFTVTATDGHDTSTFTVTVPVRAPELASSQTQIPLPGSGPNIALSGSRAYVFNKYLWTVSSIDTNTNTVIRTSQPLASGSTLSYPGNVAVSPDGTRVYVANWVEGKIIQLDPNTLAPVGQPIAVAGGGDDMVFSPDGTRLYVANDGAPGSLTVIDTNSRSVVGTIPTTYDTTDMAMSNDGRTLYLADGYYNRIQVLDTNTKSVVGYIPLGSQSYNGNPGGIALSPDGRWAYVTDPDNATVSVIDLTSRTVVGDPIVVGVPRWEASTVSWPTAIAVSADGTRVYVANGDDIVVIDAATRKVVGAVRFPGYMSDSSARATQTLAVDSNGDLLIYGGNGLTSVSLGASGSQMT